jgi:hypothetical protein
MNVDLYDDTSIILLDFEVYVLWVCIMSIALVKHQVKKKKGMQNSEYTLYYLLYFRTFWCSNEVKNIKNEWRRFRDPGL